jgi:hypothetical protein
MSASIRFVDCGFAMVAIMPKSRSGILKRVRLENAFTPTETKAALDDMLVRRRKGQTIVQRQAPTFASFAEDYLEFHRQAKDPNTHHQGD